MHPGALLHPVLQGCLWVLFAGNTPFFLMFSDGPQFLFGREHQPPTQSSKSKFGVDILTT